MKISINSLTIHTWPLSTEKKEIFSPNIHHNKKGWCMDFHFSSRLLRGNCVNSKGKKGYSKSSIYWQWNMNLLINFECFSFFWFDNQITWIIIHFHTQFTAQFLKMLKWLASSSSCVKNSWSKIWDLTPRLNKKRFVFIFATSFNRFLSKLMNLTLGKHAVMFTDKSNVQRKLPSKFNLSTLWNRFFGHSRLRVERRLKAMLRFFTQLMSFQSNSLIWLYDKSKVL